MTVRHSGELGNDRVVLRVRARSEHLSRCGCIASRSECFRSIRIIKPILHDTQTHNLNSAHMHGSRADGRGGGATSSSPLGVGLGVLSMCVPLSSGVDLVLHTPIVEPRPATAFLHRTWHVNHNTGAHVSVIVAVLKHDSNHSSYLKRSFKVQYIYCNSSC